MANNGFNPSKINVNDLDISSVKETKDTTNEDTQAAVIAELKRKIETLEATNSKNTPNTNTNNTPTTPQKTQQEMEVEAVNDIIQGQTKTFKKHYSFPVLNGDDIIFDIELKPANAIESIKVAQEASQLAGGLINMLDTTAQELINAIATFRVLRVNVPAMLIDFDNNYRTDIVFQVYEDYIEWLDYFRQHQQA